MLSSKELSIFFCYLSNVTLDHNSMHAAEELSSCFSKRGRLTDTFDDVTHKTLVPITNCGESVLYSWPDFIFSGKTDYLSKMNDQVDLSPVVDEQLAVIGEMPFEEALLQLHTLERRCRIAKDDLSNRRVCNAIADRCIQERKWIELGTNIATLSKRRGYSRMSITEIIDKSMEVLEQLKGSEVYLPLLETVRDVTEGKIFRSEEHT